MDPLSTFRDRFGAPRALIGMLHVGALPGTPAARHSIDRLIEQTVAQARVYRDAGFTALALENMHDRPYLKGGVGPEITAAMTALAREVRRETGLVLGIQVLAAANREALAVALAAGAEFVRVEGFVFAHVADEGVIESCAGSCCATAARLAPIASWCSPTSRRSTAPTPSPGTCRWSRPPGPRSSFSRTAWS
jgi:predicted TIM-barrel enzyme